MNFAATQRDTIELIDATSGQCTIVAGTEITIIIGPNGERAVVQREVLARSNDQRVITPNTEVFSCGCGCNALPLLVRDSITFCESCRIPVAVSHAKKWDDGIASAVVCPSCWAPGHLQRAIKKFFRWILEP